TEECKGTSNFFGHRPIALLQRVEFHVSEKYLSTFGLKENLAARRKRIGAFVDQLAVHVLPYVPVFVDQLDHVPLSVRFLDLVHGITITNYVLPRAFIETVNFHGTSRRSGHPLAIFSCQRR